MTNSEQNYPKLQNDAKSLQDTRSSLEQIKTSIEEPPTTIIRSKDRTIGLIESLKAALDNTRRHHIIWMLSY